MDELVDDNDEVEVIYLDELLEDEEINEDVNSEDIAEVQDLAKLTFIKHSKSVFCGDLNKDGQLAATGGEDDCAYLWSTETGDIALDCTGHKDSIIAACFNHDGQLLATGDMSGMIQVWDVKDQKLIWCYEGDDMEWLMWHQMSNILIGGTHSGETYIWQVPQGNVKILPSHGSSCTSGKLLPDGKNILTGYEDGCIKLWDIKSSSVQWQFSDANKPSVTSLEINADGSLLSVAPHSSLLKVVDGRSLGSLLVQNENEIEVHAFVSELNLLITGSLSGQVCVWDLHTLKPRNQAFFDSGITILKLGLNGKAFFGTTSGAIYKCDIRSGAVDEIMSGHRSNILSISLSNDGRYMLSTSDDQTAKIFTIKQ